MSAVNEPLHGAEADKVRDQLAAARATLAPLEAGGRVVSNAHQPLLGPECGTRDWRPSLDIARYVARQALDRHQDANIHDHTAMLRAATSLAFVLDDLLAALDKEGE